MKDANIDQLLRILTPRFDLGSAGTGRPRGHEAAFESHFRQAGEASLPVALPSPPPGRPASGRDEYRSHGATQKSTDSGRPAEQPSAAEPPPAESTRSTTAAVDSDGPKRDSNDHETREETGADSTTEASATAVPPAKTDTPDAADQEAAKAEAALAEPIVDPEYALAEQVRPGDVASRLSKARPRRDASVESAQADRANSAELHERPAEVDEAKANRESAAKPGASDAKAVKVASDAVIEQGEQDPQRQTVTLASNPTADVDDSQNGATVLPDQLDETASREATSDRRSSSRSRRDQAAEITERSAQHGRATDLANQSAAKDVAAAVDDPAPATSGSVVGKKELKVPAQSDATTLDGNPSDAQVHSRANGRTASPQPGSPAVANAAAQVTPLPASAVEINSNSGTKATKPAADAKEGLLTAFSRFDRHGTLGTRGAGRAGERPDAPHVDPTRFVNRVARAIHTAQERGGPLQLRLSPPELGSLRLELSVRQGVLTANVETDNSVARQTLLDSLPALRARLAEQNIRIERFDVDVRRDGDGNLPNYNPRQHDGHHNQRHDTAPSQRSLTGRDAAEADTIDERPQARRSISDTSINVMA